MKEKKQPSTYFRISSRIRQDQADFAKKEAERLGIKEGELHRIIFDFYIKNYKKIK